MRHLLTVFLSGMVLAISSLLSQNTFAANNVSDQWAPGRILVKPATGTSKPDFEEVLARLGGKSQETIGSLDIHIVSVPQHTEDAVVDALSRNPSIQFAEKDFLVELSETSANDTHYSDAWHLAKINAPQAWDNSLGNGVVVAVLDTGVDSSHPDLQGQLLPGWNSYDNNDDTTDVHGHGTMVTGVIAAASNNNTGVTSIAWQAKVLPVRISLPSGSAYTSTIARGLNWAADNGANVANISYAVSGSSSVRNAADYLRSKGGLTFIAAGNNGAEQTTFPYTSVITVSATHSSDGLTSWSNYGNVIDLAGPGSGIWTTKRGGGYGAVSGTSFSSPASAAVAALVMAANPSLSPEEVETILFENSADLGTPGHDIYFGYGRIDAEAAVLAALGGQGTPGDTEDPLVSITSPAGGTVSGTVSVAISATDNKSVTLVELYANGRLVGTDSTAPYTVDWDSSADPDGPVQLAAFAHDAAGNTGVSSSVNVEVDNIPEDTEPPVITIVTPASDGTTTVSGRVSIEVIAIDNVGVTRLDVYIEGKLMGSSSDGNISFQWNTRKLADGEYIMSSEASDAAGNTTVSTVTLTLNNTGGDTGGTGGDTGGDTGSGSSDFCASRPNHNKCR